MKCDLAILDSLILNNLNPENLIEEKSESNFTEWLSIAEKFQINYQTTFFSELLAFHDVKLIKKHVQCHQSRLILLSDKLYYFMSLSNKKPKKYCSPPLSLYKIQNAVYNILEELLNFLQHQFPKYFKLLHAVPKKLDKSTKEKFKSDIQKLKNRLVANENKLWEIAFQPYEEFIKSERKSLIYQEIDYLQALLYELELIPGSSLFKQDEELLKNTLIQNNFNSWPFFHYLSDEIKYIVQLEETLTGQLEKYYWHQKVINQTIIKQGVILSPERMSIKDAISEWISEEIIFHEKKVQLLPPVNEQIKLGYNNFKVLTELSVSQYALFLRLINENGIIKNKNTKELLRFHSQHTQTKKVLNVSPDSLYVKYYNVSETDRQVVKSYIIKILNQLNNKLVMLIPLAFYFFDLDIDLDSLLILQNIF